MYSASVNYTLDILLYKNEIEKKNNFRPYTDQKQKCSVFTFVQYTLLFFPGTMTITMLQDIADEGTKKLMLQNKTFSTQYRTMSFFGCVMNLLANNWGKK